MQQVDLSGGLSEVFQTLFSWLGTFISLLNNIMIFPHVSLLVLMIGLVVISMIISTVFVIFDPGADLDDD